jgi:hypothetical protein
MPSTALPRLLSRLAPMIRRLLNALLDIVTGNL